MPAEFTSDNLSIPGIEPPMTVGEARDFLDSRKAVLNPKKLLEIARGLGQLVHDQIDYTQEGHLRLLPDEIKRRAAAGDEFLNMPETRFLAEEK